MKPLDGNRHLCRFGIGEVKFAFFRTLQEHPFGIFVERLKIKSFFLAEITGQQPVKIAAPKTIIAADSQNVDNIVKTLDKGHIKGTAAKIKNKEICVLLGIHQLAGKSGSRGLIDQPFHLQASQLTGPLCGRALSVVKVSGDTDDGFLHRLL